MMMPAKRIEYEENEKIEDICLVKMTIRAVGCEDRFNTRNRSFFFSSK